MARGMPVRAAVQRIRIMTWNLWWRFGHRWRERQPRIRSVIEAAGPDVIGLQETWGDGRSSQADELATGLGMHAVFAAPSLPPPPDPPEHPDQAGMEVGVAVISRWPIREVRELRLRSAHRPEIVALRAVIAHPDGALPVTVTCLDWEPETSPTRMAQAEAVAELAAAPHDASSLPSVLVGDLNVPPDAPEIRSIAASMTDAWAAVHGSDEPGVTLSSANPLASSDAWQIDRRIDYVFVRPGVPPASVEVDAAFLAGDRDGDMPGSDHYAVVADLRVG
jgi:endonuclease/exonuclease/phosphatase family metal-dependent hydrolase